MSLRQVLSMLLFSIAIGLIGGWLLLNVPFPLNLGGLLLFLSLLLSIETEH